MDIGSAETFYENNSDVNAIEPLFSLKANYAAEFQWMDVHSSHFCCCCMFASVYWKSSSISALREMLKRKTCTRQVFTVEIMNFNHRRKKLRTSWWKISPLTNSRPLSTFNSWIHLSSSGNVIYIHFSTLPKRVSICIIWFRPQRDYANFESRCSRSILIQNVFGWLVKTR